MDAGEHTLPHGFVRSNPDSVSWLAAAAVIAGAVGAIACMRYYSQRRYRRWPRAVTSQDSHAVNPPHGDKLLSRTS